MHCHFSKIEFTAQGEKHHHTLDEERFGPDFRMLAEVIADFKMHPTMICESPILDVDARKMKETLKDNTGKPKTNEKTYENKFFASAFNKIVRLSCSSCTVLMLTANSSRSSR